MKNNLLLILVGLTISTANSQEIKDAMRYSQSDLQGTARFTAMSGAFGALGGDLSSISVNPAGSAIFNNNQFVATIANDNTNNNSNYFGTSSSASKSSFDINQAGGVFVFNNGNPSSDWKKISLSINYENTNNYNNSLFSAGISPSNSVANYFLSYANGIPLKTLKDSNYNDLNNDEQQAFLGYQGYIIDPVDINNNNNTLYTSNVRPGGNYYQENSTYSNGYNGKLVFNTALQYKDKIYFGLNLNSHFTDYVKDTNFYESNNNLLDSNYEVQRLNFSNSLHTYGSGFSFQVGAIAKITNEIRMGFAFESPTWYNLQDDFSQRLSSTRSNTTNTLNPDIVTTDLITYAPYDLRTPGSLTGSFAYVFAKSGLISIDYKYKDYSQTQYGPKNDIYFRNLNEVMQSQLGSSNEVRIGAEYRIQNLKLRGGYRFEGSPYNNSKTVGDLNSFSGGLGYNFGFIKLDVAYVNIHTSSQDQFFTQGFTENAKINTYKNNFIMTVVFEM